MSGKMSETMHKGQPSGEAWERLVEACREYRDLMKNDKWYLHPYIAKIVAAFEAYEAAQSAEPQRPKIVCLCGSTRFAKEFADANERETLSGNIVLSVGCFRRTAPDGQREPMEESVKAALDVLHKRKIDLADEVLVLNVGGYIGDSTRSEIEHARKTGKRVRYLEPGRTPTNDPPLPASTDEPPESQIAIQQGMIERLTKERDEARSELRSLSTISGQTIAELRSELDETRTERHAYKSRLREFCQRLVDMVGAEGPEDVQGMLDKVNAELHRLKQNIDSMSANLADKEGFLNSAGDEIERLTKERDELRVTIDLDRANWDRVQDANYRTIAELQARLAKPEMPECVRELLEWAKSEDLNEPAKQIAAVEAHYAPPFRIDKLGVYATENGNPWEVIYIDPKGGVVARHKTTKLLENFHMSGACKGGQFSLTKYLRPLEG